MYINWKKTIIKIGDRAIEKEKFTKYKRPTSKEI